MRIWGFGGSPHPSPLPSGERGQETSLNVDDSFFTTKAMNEIIALPFKDLELENLLRAPAPLLPPWEKGLGG
jgi:hypothetical protein